MIHALPTISDPGLLIRRFDKLFSRKEGPIIIIIIIIMMTMLTLPPGLPVLVVLVVLLPILHIVSPTTTASQTRPRPAHPARPPATVSGSPARGRRRRCHAAGLLRMAEGVRKGEGMEFVLVLLVPGPAVLGARDLAGLVVFDVGALGGLWVGVVLGLAVLAAVAAAALEGLFHLGAEWHRCLSVLGSSLGGGWIGRVGY
jgi:hypothetical protein